MRLELSYPLNYISINQAFGVYSDVYNAEGMKGHNGIDFFANMGTPVFATHDGLASYQVDTGGGHGVVIISQDQFQTGFDNQVSLIKTIYWHLCDPLKYPKWKSPIADKTGLTPVKNGDLIGYADNTGASTGSHLHFGLKTVAQGETPGSFYNLNQMNGYFGAIDPAPYFDGTYPKQIEIMTQEVGILQKAVNLLKQFLGLS